MAWHIMNVVDNNIFLLLYVVVGFIVVIRKQTNKTIHFIHMYKYFPPDIFSFSGETDDKTPRTFSKIHIRSFTL